MQQYRAGQPCAPKQVIVPAGQHPRTAQQKPQATAALICRRCRRAAAVCGGLPVQQQQHQQQQVPHQQWCALTDVRWEGSEQDALQPGSPMAAQLPLWRLLLLSDGEQLLHLGGNQHLAVIQVVRDAYSPHIPNHEHQHLLFGHVGSVTRHLQLLTGSAVKVDCLAMDPVPAGAGGLPPVVHEMLAAPLLQREVLLRHKDDEGRALVHATSWWNAAAASSNLRDPSQPIWVSLTQAHKELYREIQTVQLGDSAMLESHFGTSGPFWGRLYLFWHGGQPLTVIHEVFSPHLEEYLLPGNGDR